MTHHGGVHILPLRKYLLVGAVLFLLTGLTVLASQQDFGGMNLVIALVIAAGKGTLVVLYFMHLRYDNRFFGIIFVTTVFLLAAFIIFTMFDTARRGDLYAESASPINRTAVIYDSDGTPLPMDQRQFGPSQGILATGGQQPDDVPFELRHGYGPITEVVEVGPLDTVMAKEGEKIFESKCATCHKLDERYTGPPLRGVTVYRSPTFIMNQILAPRENVEKHPDMQAMLKTYYTIMTNQNVSVEGARKLVEYLRWEATRGIPETETMNDTAGN